MSEIIQQRRGLGRGLGSLIPTAPPPADSGEHGSASRPEGGDAPAGPVPSPEGHRGQDMPADGLGQHGHAPAQEGEAPDAGADGTGEGLGEENPGAADWIGRSGEAGEDAGRRLHAVPAPEGTIRPDGEGPDLAPVVGAHFAELPLDAIMANPRQPRQVFDEEAMAELVHSVREVGLLQPIVVRPLGEGRYELVMGERRWRAVQHAGFATIAAIVRDTDDDALLRDALLENLHRAELNALEEAAAYQQLLDDFGCTHDELATRIGRSRPQISNTLRLLKLSPAVQRRVAAGVISAGHARTLLGVEDAEVQDRLAGRVVAEGISVRGLEEIVAVGAHGAAPAPRSRRSRPISPAAEDLAVRLGDLYETRVKVDLGRARGKIVIEFASVSDLERIVGVMDPTYQRRSDGEETSRQSD